MSLASVRSESAQRFSELHSMLAEMKAREATEGRAITLNLKVQRGLFLVALYAGLENTVTQCVNSVSQHIASQSLSFSKLNHHILAFSFDPEFKSLSAKKRRKHILARQDIFKIAKSSDPAPLYCEPILAEVQNIWTSTLQFVFLAFGIVDNPLYDMTKKGMIDDIVDKRNAVSHGRMSPVDVGERYNSSDIEIRLLVVEQQKEYIIDRFERYILMTEYL
jgi:RiboL-PSP-HEPN